MPPRLRLLLAPLSLAVGIALYSLTSLAEPARATTLNFGSEYAAMAADPFALIGKFPHRILSPLVAHSLGFGGERFVLFAKGCMVLFLAMVFAAAVLRGARLVPALVLTTAIGFTGALQLYKDYVGYPDPVTFTLLLATILASRRPVLFWVLQALNLFHHEQVFFFWPWLLWWRRRDGNANWRHDALGAAIVAGVYVAWRYWVGAHAPQLMLTLEHYQGLGYFPRGTIGLTVLDTVLTFYWFGFLPVVVAWHAFADGWRRAGFGIAFWIASTLAIFVVAHDVERFACFLVVPLFLACVRLLQERRGVWILAGLGALTIAAVQLQKPVWTDLTQVLFGEVLGKVGPENVVRSIVTELVPARPWTFASYGLVAVATVVAGSVWARSRADSRPRSHT